MNPKFFDVKKEKQDAIINACLKVFAENGYKKASTDVIVKTAGISKGLLFHYFESKKGAYEFIYDYSVKYMMLELTQSVRKNERDFFEIQRTIEGVKTRVMRNYPYMQQFLNSVKYEEHPDALDVIGEDRDVLKDTYGSIYGQADMSRFDDFVDINRVINMINWMSEGFIKDKFTESEDPDLDEMNEEFSRYLIMLRDHLYRPGMRRSTFIKPLNEAENTRSRIVLDGMSEKKPEKESRPAEGRSSSLSQLARQLNNASAQKKVKSAAELSFEERLAIKDTSIFGVPIPPREEKKPEPVKKAEPVKADEPEKKEEIKEKEEKTEQVKAPVTEDKKQAEQIPSGEENIKAAQPAEERTVQDSIQESAKETPAAETEELKALGEAVEKTAAEAMIEDEAVKEVSNAQEKPAEALEASEEAPAGFGTGLTSMENENGDSDMIDLNALYSKRMEEAFEDLGIGMQEPSAAAEEGEPLPEVMYQAGPEDIYAYQDGNMQFYGPEEQYYAPGDYPQGVYMNETEQMFMDMGNLYSEDMYEDDSDAYAQLYNSVNNYDVNGATQEMPINEVLAYRNAFTNEYINEELSGESSGARLEENDQKKIMDNLDKNVKNDNSKKLVQKIGIINKIKNLSKTIKERKNKEREEQKLQEDNIKALYENNKDENLPQENLDNIANNVINDIFDDKGNEIAKENESNINKEAINDIIKEEKIKNAAKILNYLNNKDKKDVFFFFINKNLS